MTTVDDLYTTHRATAQAIAATWGLAGVGSLRDALDEITRQIVDAYRPQPAQQDDPDPEPEPTHAEPEPGEDSFQEALAKAYELQQTLRAEADTPTEVRNPLYQSQKTVTRSQA